MLKYAEAKIISIKSKGKSVPVVELTCDVSGERIKYNITEGTYREIGCPLSGEEIDSGALECIEREDEQRRAVAKALSLIGGDDTKALQKTFCKPDGMDFDSSLGTFVTKGGYKMIIDLKQ